MHLEHVNLTVADLDRSVDFYTRLFDLKVRWLGTTRDGTPAAHVGDDRAYLALFEGRGSLPDQDYGQVGINHIGFVVDDLEAAKVRLSSLDARVHSEQEYDPGRRLYFRDPDGIEIELVQYEPMTT